eukprot:TRINITY_DN682_c0_g1_i1.p2 TRINITY_DN682_c0_g1~~TRINITY_DN682_c0_g1_i1.p2  ORF type:complete len:441 (-),score=54.28 TRINITY_DN682_c0_g1_i1:542-1864(-)
MTSSCKFSVVAVFLTIVQLAVAASLLDRPSVQRPTMVLSKFYGFSKFFPADQFSGTCEEAKENCVNRCTEENMQFQCSSFYGIRSTCTCISKPQAPQNVESVRCQNARNNCKISCVGEPNFQCADNGYLFSQSCSCVEISPQGNNHDNSSPVFSEPEIEDFQPELVNYDTLESVDNGNYQVFENHVYETVELYGIVPEEESISPVAEQELEELDLHINEDIDECELAFSDCQIKCGVAIPEFECVKEQFITSTSCACVSGSFSEGENEKDEAADSISLEEVSSSQSESPTSENDTKQLESENPLDTKCLQAHNACAKKCGSTEFKFDCSSQGNSFAKSCVCSQNAYYNDKQTVGNFPNEVISQENIKSDGCEVARQDCDNKCGALEPKFECKNLGSSFVKSCVCSSGSSFSSSKAQTFVGPFNREFGAGLLDQFRRSQKP